MGRVTEKRLAEIKGVGLPISKGAGFCWIYNSVLCSYQRSGNTGYIERCKGCSEFIRAEHDEVEEDEQNMREIDEAFRRMAAGEEQGYT